MRFTEKDWQTYIFFERFKVYFRSHGECKPRHKKLTVNYSNHDSRQGAELYTVDGLLCSR